MQMSNTNCNRRLDAATLHFARRLRAKATSAERLLWQQLRRRGICNARFRRQHAIGGIVIDFYCFEVRLAVEVDGPGHNANADTRRDERLARRGITVLRVGNEEVLWAMEEVLEEIRDVIEGLRERSEGGGGFEAPPPPPFGHLP